MSFFCASFGQSIEEPDLAALTSIMYKWGH